MILLAGCHGTPPIPKPPAPQRPLSSFSFKTPELKTTITRLDAAARDHSGSGETTTPFLACAWDVRRYEANWQLFNSGDVEHKILLALSSADRQPLSEIDGVEIRGQYYQSGSWGAAVSYCVTQRESESHGGFLLSFCDKSQLRQSASSSFVLQLPSSYCEAEIREDQQSFLFRVQADNAGYQPMTTIHEKLRGYLASPDALYESGLNDLVILEKKVREDMETGVAWNAVIDWSIVRADSPPMEMPPKSTDTLPPELKSRALDALLGEIERRRQLLRDHNRELHSVAQKAFPLFKFASLDSTESVESSEGHDRETPNQTLEPSGRTNR